MTEKVVELDSGKSVTNPKIWIDVFFRPSPLMGNKRSVLNVLASMDMVVRLEKMQLLWNKKSLEEN